jgi:hypothetical protein
MQTTDFTGLYEWMSLSLSLSRARARALSLSLPPSLPPSLPLSLPLSLSPSLSLSLSLSLCTEVRLGRVELRQFDEIKMLSALSGIFAGCFNIVMRLRDCAS